MFKAKGVNKVYASVTLAGEHLYISDWFGITAVIKPGRTFKLESTNQLERFRGSPVFEGTRMYIRGFNKLYCIGK